MIKQSLNGAWQFCQVGFNEWLPAVVPGGVHTDLMATGRISDPFVADNELNVQWVADADWTYRRTFEPSQELLDSERVELVCDGLDTLATSKAEWKPGGHSRECIPPIPLAGQRIFTTRQE